MQDCNQSWIKIEMVSLRRCIWRTRQLVGDIMGRFNLVILLRNHISHACKKVVVVDDGLPFTYDKVASVAVAESVLQGDLKNGWYGDCPGHE